MRGPKMAEDRAGAWDPFILLDLLDLLDRLDRLDRLDLLDLLDLLDRPLQANTR